MVCLICFQPAAGICGDCRRELRPATAVRNAGRLPVAAAYLHHGPARILVRRLKYEGMAGVAAVLAAGMAERVHPGTVGLVPIPRVLWRRVRYGIDPAGELARALSAATGLAIYDALRAPLWWPRRAGRERSRRREAVFDAIKRVPDGVALVDDVLTTGGTLQSAAAVLGSNVRSALTATMAPYTMSGRPAQGIRGARERA